MPNACRIRLTQPSHEVTLDSNPSRQVHALLNPEALEPVRAAICVYVSSRSTPAVLSEALSRMSSEARKCGMLPEHMVLVFKDTWNGLPEVRAMGIDEQTRLLEVAVTMCIEEYYRL